MKNKTEHNNTLSALFEAANDCILFVTENGIIQNINGNGLKLLGFEQHEKEQLIGKNLTSLTSVKNAKKIQKQIIGLDKELTDMPAQIPIIMKDGGKIKCEIKLKSIGLQQNPLILVIIHHVNSLEEVMQKVENSGNRFDELIENFPHGLLKIRWTGQIIDANTKYCEYSGYTWDELISQNYVDLLFDNRFNTSHIKKKGKKIDPKIFQSPHRTKKGELMPVRTGLFHEKNIIYIFIDNISKEIELMNGLQQWRVTVDKLLNGLKNKEGVGIMLAEHTIGLTFANDFICETFGYTKDELLQLDVHYLMDWRDQQENIDKYLAILNGDTKKTTMVVKFVRKDKSIFQANVNLTDHNGTTIVEFDKITDTNDRITEDQDTTLMNAVQKLNDKNKGLLILSAKEGISYANKVAFEAFGYKNNEMNGIKHARHFTHQEYLSKIARSAVTVYTGIKSTIEFPVWFTKKDGTIFAADLTIGKHKEKKVKYLVLQFENINHDPENQAANSPT